MMCGVTEKYVEQVAWDALCMLFSTGFQGEGCEPDDW